MPERVTAGLQALYTFLEGSGTTVGDVSGVGSPMDLTIKDIGNVTWLPGGGLRIDSGTQIDTPGAATKIMDAQQLTNELTYECWVTPLNITQDPTKVMTNSNSNGGVSRNVTIRQEADVWRGRIRANGENRQFTTGADGVTTNLTHVMVTRTSAGQINFYINGALVDSPSRVGEFSEWDTTRAFVLVNERTGDHPWLGDIFLAAVYDRALTVAEVATNLNAGTPTATTLSTFVRSFATPSSLPEGLAFDGRTLWHSDRNTDLIYQIFRDGSVLRSFATPGAEPRDLTYDGRVLWHCDATADLIYALSLANGSVIRSFATPGSDPSGLTFDGRNLWHCDQTAAVIYALDPRNGAVTRSFAAPASAPRSLAYAARTLWLSDSGSDRIYGIDPRDGSVLRSFTTGATPTGLTSDGRTLWHCDADADLIYQISLN